jgi:hypothetical protein
MLYRHLLGRAQPIHERLQSVSQQRIQMGTSQIQAVLTSVGIRMGYYAIYSFHALWIRVFVAASLIAIVFILQSHNNPRNQRRFICRRCYLDSCRSGALKTILQTVLRFRNVGVCKGVVSGIMLSFVDSCIEFPSALSCNLFPKIIQKYLCLYFT